LLIKNTRSEDSRPGYAFIENLHLVFNLQNTAIKTKTFPHVLLATSASRSVSFFDTGRIVARPGLFVKTTAPWGY
jgi:hypothetical protein